MCDENREVVLDIDLECHRCKNKIRKVLCKYQEEWNIESVTYDDKNNKVTVSGPFDPEKVVKKLCCKACKVIRKWCIKEKPQAAPALEKPEKEKPQAAPALEKPEKEKPEPQPEPPKPLKPTWYPYPYPYPYPCPLPIYCCSCGGHRSPCSCGGCCHGYRPCACGCHGGCSGALGLGYGRPCLLVCEEETTSACSLM